MANPVMLYQSRTGKTSSTQSTPTYGQYYTNTGAYPQAANPYAAAYQTPYAAGVSGYGSWPYPYSYVAHPYSTTSVVASGTSAQISQLGPQRTTFTAYTPYTPYRKDTSQATGGQLASGVTRGPRKQSNFKGLFAKERELKSTQSSTSVTTALLSKEPVVCLR